MHPFAAVSRRPLFLPASSRWWGDLAQPDSLRAAMAGVDRVFLLCGPHRDAVKSLRNATDAAAASEVGLLVRSSIIDADKESPAEFISSHTQCDGYLGQSGPNYAILRPNLLLQNMPESTIPSIGEDGNFHADAGDARISMVDTRDIAAVAEVVLTEDGHAGAHYDITGPEELSYQDAAAKLSAALERRINYVDVPDDAVRTTLLGPDLDQWFVDALIGRYQDYRSSEPTDTRRGATDDVERLSGRPPRSLDDLLPVDFPRLTTGSVQVSSKTGQVQYRRRHGSRSSYGVIEIDKEQACLSRTAASLWLASENCRSGTAFTKFQDGRDNLLSVPALRSRSASLRDPSADPRPAINEASAAAVRGEHPWFQRRLPRA